MIPNRHNTLILVVTYNPDLTTLNNIKTHCEITDNVLVVDNGSDAESIKCITESRLDHCKYIKSSENKGIAWALNHGIIYAREQGFKFLLTFDQDSSPVPNILDLYASVISENGSIRCIGTQYTDKDISKTVKIDFIDSLTVITSGCLSSLDIYDTIGLYNEMLFIDSVDFDFSLSVKKAGYRIVRSVQPLIKHHLGTPRKRFGITTTNHNVFRRYYQVRNHIYITRKYLWDFPGFVLKKNYFFLDAMIRMIIADDNRIDKIKAAKKGFMDGLSLKIIGKKC